MFEKILIANRGEIAVRVARTCRDLGVGCVAVYSDADADSMHVAAADEAMRLPGVAPADTYLNIEALLDAASSASAQAIHPGYGFLAENAGFAEATNDAGLVWIGPPPEATRLIGDKIRARRLAASAGVPIVPGLTDPVEDLGVVASFAAEHGYPVAIKAAGGGGGRGFRVARSEEEVEPAFTTARREAEAYFSSSEVFVERYLDAPKHLEVQILAPTENEALWLGVRDCSLQRRHQKLVEETPPPRFGEIAPEMGEAAVALSKACGYSNAGTVEMLVDNPGNFYFLEVNARLQVEHTVTEEVFGIDLVACQLKIAAREPLGFTQSDLQPRGHSIECRINAEDPGRAFVPSPGKIVRYAAPAGAGIRVDAGYRAGDLIPAAYDSLVAKVIATGATREEARRRMLRALDEMVIEGVPTTIPAHRLLLEDEAFVRGEHTTATLETSGALEPLLTEEAVSEEGNVLLVAGRRVRLWHPAMSSSAAAAVAAGSSGELTAPMQGTILKVLADEGDQVGAGRPLIVLEAMKMETTIAAPKAGRIVELRVAVGQTVPSGEVLAVVG